MGGMAVFMPLILPYLQGEQLGARSQWNSITLELETAKGSNMDDAMTAVEQVEELLEDEEAVEHTWAIVREGGAHVVLDIAGPHQHPRELRALERRLLELDERVTNAVVRLGSGSASGGRICIHSRRIGCWVGPNADLDRDAHVPGQ